jgi:hypothetical protein
MAVMSPVMVGVIPNSTNPTGLYQQHVGLPTNLVLGSTSDTAIEPYYRSDIWKVVILLVVSAIYGISFGLAVVRSGGGFGGLFAAVFLLGCAAWIAWEATSMELRFDKTTRSVSYSEWRLLSHVAGPNRLTVRFEDLAGDCIVASDSSSKQCWCMNATRSIVYLRLKTGGRPLAAQRVHNVLAAQQVAAWTQYISSIGY